MALTGSLLALLTLIILGGYLVGSLLPADWFVRRRTGRSPDEMGDNPGGAGAWRLAGPGAAILTTLFDLAKGAFPLAVARAAGLGEVLGLGPSPVPVGPAGVSSTWLRGLLLAAVACAPVAGHNWPAFRRFRGGRGLSSAAGALLCLAWQEMLPALALGIAVASWRRWVPVIGIVAFPVGVGLMLARGAGSPRIIAALAVMSVVLLRQAPWARANLGNRAGR